MSDDGERGHPAPETRGQTVTPTVPDDLAVMLDVLTETIVDVIGFGVAGISIVRADGLLETMSVAGDQSARESLLGKVESPEMWDEILDLSEPWGRLWFLDHRSMAGRSHPFTWIPEVEPIAAADAWHPEDSLFSPLTSQDGARMGVLAVTLPRDGRRPRPETCHALEAFVISAALAIEHSALRSRAESSERRYRMLAMRDQLTGVATRPMFFEQIGSIAARRKGGGSVAVLFVDLDRFKSVNDEHSHLAGDHVLRVVARRIESCVRDEDTVVRWGGDEFAVVIASPLSEEAAAAVADRVAASIEAPIEFKGLRLTVCASVGVAYAEGGDVLDPDALIHRADMAMYQVKHGR